MTMSCGGYLPTLSFAAWSRHVHKLGTQERTLCTTLEPGLPHQSPVSSQGHSLRLQRKKKVHTGFYPAQLCIQVKIPPDPRRHLAEAWTLIIWVIPPSCT